MSVKNVEPEFKMTDCFVAIIYREKEIAFEKVGGQIGSQLSDKQHNI